MFLANLDSTFDNYDIGKSFFNVITCQNNDKNINTLRQLFFCAHVLFGE